MNLIELCTSARLELATQPNLPASLPIAGVVHDSRQVTPGCLFVAIKGLQFDSHQVLDQVVAQGAAAIVHSNQQAVKNIDIPTIYVKDSNLALGLLWAAWLNWPSRQLKVAGVTGTDGKTTTVNLLHHLLVGNGLAAGSISTISARIGQQTLETGLHVTSPNAPEMQQLLQKMVEAGQTHLVLEVTSHAIDQHRIAGIEFDQSILTNITLDHLDYHKTIENYRDTKAKLFQKTNYSIINQDDSLALTVAPLAAGKLQLYGLTNSAFTYARDIVATPTHQQFLLAIDGQQQQAQLKMPGFYNVSNALAAATAAYNWGIPISDIARQLASFQQIAGRFEEIETGKPYRVIIDFAHTPNSLHQVLDVARQQLAAGAHLWHIFGCAGQRDKGKRPEMGYQSGQFADTIILTAEDPRDEQVSDINQQIIPGLRKAGASHRLNSAKRYIEIDDRQQAITHALNQAQPGDIILITGKGHEQSLAIGDQELPWSDRQAVIQATQAA